MSNEHPDMHGNPMDAPLLCEQCGKDFKEENIFGTSLSDQVFFCSSNCAMEWEDAQNDNSNFL